MKSCGISTDSTAAAVEDISVGLKHAPVDVGSTGSIALRRANSRPLAYRVLLSDESGIPTWTQFPENSNTPESKTREKGELSSDWKHPGYPYAGSPPLRHSHLLWISSSVAMFIIFFVALTYSAVAFKLNLHQLLKHRGFEPRQSIHPWRAEVDQCLGKRVYIYDLPPQFNVQVLEESRCKHSIIKWMNLCPRFTNGGYGVQIWNISSTSQLPYDEDFFDPADWFDTDFYMLEMIFHTRLQRNYRCLTEDWARADALFVPYYTGLLALDPLYKTPDLTPSFEMRKRFGQEALEWVGKRAAGGGQAWRRHGGRDHFLIMGRTTWDFHVHELWGTGFSGLPEVANMTTLLLERNRWLENQVAIPYPTAFHPASRGSLARWIARVERAERKHLFTYVGAPRSESWSVRGIITSSCATAGPAVCKFVNCAVKSCSHNPIAIYKAFLRSNFCLQPRGDSATRRSSFDCLISGAIPVFFHEDSAYTQFSWHLPREPESYSVYISEDDLRKETVSIEQVLMSYSPERIHEIRRTIIAIIPSLLYSNYANDPGSSAEDAFELSVRRVLEKIAAAKGFDQVPS